jgi:hypothetical protein
MIVVVSASAFLFGQTDTSSKTTSIKTSNASVLLMGTVSSVGTGNIIVKTKKANATLMVESKTEIVSRDSVIALSTIKAGALVVVTYRKINDNKVASKIDVITSAPDTTGQGKIKAGFSASRSAHSK